MKIKVIKRPLRYAGKVYDVRQIVDVRDRDGRLLVKIGKAEAIETGTRPIDVPKVNEEINEAETPKRFYKRRDLEAETKDLTNEPD